LADAAIEQTQAQAQEVCSESDSETSKEIVADEVPSEEQVASPFLGLCCGGEQEWNELQLDDDE
jgi:hypothetical protein